MKNQASQEVFIAVELSLSKDQVSEQELTLIGQFLPELLKEMIWQSSEEEN